MILKYYLLSIIFCSISGLFAGEKLKTVTLKADDGKELELSLSVAEQSLTLAEMLESSESTDAPLELEIAWDILKQTFDIVHEASSLDPEKVEEYIKEVFHSVLHKEQLCLVLKAASYLNIPLFLKNLPYALVKKLTQPEELQAFLDNPTYIQDLNLPRDLEKTVAAILLGQLQPSLIVPLFTNHVACTSFNTTSPWLLSLAHSHSFAHKAHTHSVNTIGNKLAYIQFWPYTTPEQNGKIKTYNFNTNETVLLDRDYYPNNEHYSLQLLWNPHPGHENLLMCVQIKKPSLVAIDMWDVQNKERKKTVILTDWFLGNIDWHESGKYFYLTQLHDNRLSIVVYDLAVDSTPKQLIVEPENSDITIDVQTIQQNPIDPFLFAIIQKTSQAGQPEKLSLHIYDVDSEKLMVTLDGIEGDVNEIAWYSTNILCYKMKNRWYRWDLKTKEIQDLRASTFIYSPGNNIMYLNDSENNALRLRDIQEEKDLKELKNSNPIEQIDSPESDPTIVAYSTYDAQSKKYLLHIHNFSNHSSRIIPFTSKIAAMRWHPIYRNIIAVVTESNLSLWDINTGKSIFQNKSTQRFGWQLLNPHAFMYTAPGELEVINFEQQCTPAPNYLPTNALDQFLLLYALENQTNLKITNQPHLQEIFHAMPPALKQAITLATEYHEDTRDDKAWFSDVCTYVMKPAEYITTLLAMALPLHHYNILSEWIRKPSETV